MHLCPLCDKAFIREHNLLVHFSSLHLKRYDPNIIGKKGQYYLCLCGSWTILKRTPSLGKLYSYFPDHIRDHGGLTKHLMECYLGLADDLVSLL